MTRILSRKWLLSLVVTLAALGLLWALGAATAGPPARPAAGPPPPTVRSTISYQGRLLEGGAPVNGLRDMVFQLYADSGCGAMLGGPISKPDVDVSDGYFSVQLDVDAAVFDGRAIWIGVSIGGSTLPCQEILPAPYALGLRPGAQIQGPVTGTGEFDNTHVLKVGLNGYYVSGTALWVYTTATGTAIRGESPNGYGVFGYTENGYAVAGRDGGSDNARGYGGYFESTNGVGAYGYSTASPGHPNIYAPGVYGKSLMGVGVYGANEPAGTVADPQISASTGSGVLGTSSLGFGVMGYSKRSYAVYGNNVGDVQGQGYGGYFTSNTGVGAYGYSQATPGHPNNNAPGVYGKSLYGTGVYGVAQGSGGRAYGGYFVSEQYRGLYAKGATNYYDAYFGGNYGIYVTGDIWAGGSKAGFVVDIALNDGPEPLKAGDVVVISGASEPVLGAIPAPRVRKASTAGSTAVMGVVARAVASGEGVSAQGDGAGAELHSAAVPAGGVVAGQYVSVVTLGAFDGIKVDASYGAIQPGDLLVSSPNPGYAMKGSDPGVGTVIGKALGALAEGTSTIPVLVTLD